MATNCDPNLTRKVQVGAKIQVDCDTPAVLGVTDFQQLIQEGPELNVEVDQIENNVARNTLTNVANIPGKKMMTGSNTSFSRGSGLSTALNEYDTAMRYSGHAAIANESIPVDLDTKAGEFFIMETISGSVSSATGRVLGYNGATLIYEPVTGTFGATDVITGADSTSSVSADGALVTSVSQASYFPKSDNFELATIRQEEDGRMKETFSAAASMGLSGEASGAVELTFDNIQGKVGIYKIVYATLGGTLPVLKGTAITDGGNTGILAADVASGDDYIVYELDDGSTAFADAASLTFGTGTATATEDSVNPAGGALPNGENTGPITRFETKEFVTKCLKFEIKGNPVSFQSFEFTQNNAITNTDDASDCTGISFAQITARNPTLNFNPLVFDAALYNPFTDLCEGDIIRLEKPLLFRNSSGIMMLSIAKIQIQSIGSEDRDGNRADPIEARVLGDADSEYALTFLSS